MHINGNYRSLVVRKLKPMDWDRIRIFLEVARTGARVNRRHKDANRASRVGSDHAQKSRRPARTFDEYLARPLTSLSDALP